MPETCIRIISVIIPFQIKGEIPFQTEPQYLHQLGITLLLDVFGGFFCQNSPKILGLSNKTDIYFLGLMRKILIFEVILEETKVP